MATMQTEPCVHVDVKIACAHPKNYETECQETTSDFILRRVRPNRISDTQFTTEKLVSGQR